MPLKYKNQQNKIMNYIQICNIKNLILYFVITLDNQMLFNIFK